MVDNSDGEYFGLSQIQKEEDYEEEEVIKDLKWKGKGRLVESCLD